MIKKIQGDERKISKSQFPYSSPLGQHSPNSHVDQRRVPGEPGGAADARESGVHAHYSQAQREPRRPEGARPGGVRCLSERQPEPLVLLTASQSRLEASRQPGGTKKKAPSSRGLAGRPRLRALACGTGPGTGGGFAAWKTERSIGVERLLQREGMYQLLCGSPSAGQTLCLILME